MEPMPEEDNNHLLETQQIMMLSLSVQQLASEARELRQALTRGRSQIHVKAILVLLGVIAAVVIGVLVVLLAG